MTALQTAVLDLADARDFAFAGGKAVNLAELIGAGFPVPDGFCVGTPAYAQAAATAGIDARARRRRPGPPGRGPRRPARHADPRRRRRRGHRRLPRARRRGAGRGAVVGHGRGPAGRELRGSAGHLPERGRRRRGARRGAPLLGVALDGPGRGLPRRRGHPRTRAPSSPWWCSGWSTRRPRACCSPPTRSAAAAPAACSTPRPGLGDAVVSGAVDPDHWVVDGDASHASGPRAAGGCLDRRGRCASLVDAGPPGRGALRRAAGHRVGARRRRARCGSPSRARSPRSTRVPRRAAGPARAPQRHRWPRACTRPITPMGLSAFRVVGAALAGLATGSPVDPMAGPAAFGIAGDRVFIDITAVAAQPGRPQAVPASLRASWRPVRRSSCASCSPTSRRWRHRRRPGAWRSPGPSCGSSLRYRVPALIALALARPAAARDVVAARRRAAARAPARAGRPATAAPGSRTS